MNRLALLLPLTATLAALVACSAPSWKTSAELGTFVLDLQEGAHRLDVRMDFQLEDDDMSCKSVHPSVTLDWAGEEGDVTLQVVALDETWEEEAVAEDGYPLTSVSGPFHRCSFTVSVDIDSPEPLLGAITVEGVAFSEGKNRGTLSGDASVALLAD